METNYINMMDVTKQVPHGPQAGGPAGKARPHAVIPDDFHEKYPCGPGQSFRSAESRGANLEGVMVYNVRKLLNAMSIACLITLAMCALHGTAHAAAPQTMGFQGFLTDASSNPLSGDYAMTFKIYEADTGGTEVWSEVHGTVTAQKGLYNVILGSQGSPLDIPFDRQYYLGITVESDDEMTPRIALTSSPYAFQGKKPLWHGQTTTANTEIDANPYQLIPIDTVVNNSAGDYLSYDSETQTFTVLKAGYYNIKISLEVFLNGSGGAPFAIIIYDQSATYNRKDVYWRVLEYATRNYSIKANFIPYFAKDETFQLTMYGASTLLNWNDNGISNIYISPADY